MVQGEKLEETREILVSLTADIIAAYVSNNSCHASDLPMLIKDVYVALRETGELSSPGLEEVVVEKQKPAIHPSCSITDNYLICLEDGRRFKSLKRHLMAHYKLTPEQYREKWGLGADYPMVAPNYAKERARLAKTTGLGRRQTAK